MASARKGTWRVQPSAGCLVVLCGHVVVARCYTKSNACLVVSAPKMLAALRSAERLLLKLNRNGDGSQLMNTQAARCLAEEIAPALDAARGKIKRAAPPRKHRPARAGGLPVQQRG